MPTPATKWAAGLDWFHTQPYKSTKLFNKANNRKPGRKVRKLIGALITRTTRWRENTRFQSERVLIALLPRDGDGHSGGQVRHGSQGPRPLRVDGWGDQQERPNWKNKTDNDTEQIAMCVT